MKKIITLLLLLTVFSAGLYADEHVYDGTQDSVLNGDTLIFDGTAPYNNIGNDINSFSELTGTIYIQGQIDSYQQIFGNNLLINSDGKITADLTLGASSVLFMSSKTVVNDGIFTIVGDGSSLIGNISDIGFQGLGEVVLNDSLLNLTNTALIQQSALTINAGKLTSDVDLLEVDLINNDDTVTLTGGTAVSGIVFQGSGELILNDSALDLTNTASIRQSTLTITAGKLTSSADLLQAGLINNNDTVTLTGGALISEVAGSGGLININVAGGGQTVFTNSVLGNEISLNHGTLKLGSYEIEEGTFTYGQIGSASQRENFTMQDNTVFDMVDGNAGNIVYVNDFNVSGTAKINADFDLAAATSDKINIGGSFSGGGSVDLLPGLNIISDFGSEGFSADIALFEGVSSANIAAIDTVYYKYRIDEGVLQVSGSYRVVNSADSLGLNFTLLQYESDPFQAAVKAYGERFLRLESNYNILENYDNIVSTGIFTLAGEGDGISVIGSSENPKSIFILQDSSTTLNIENVILKNGFNKGAAGEVFAGAIYNAGNAVLSNVIFDANSVNVTASADSDSFAYGGAVYNLSFLDVSDSQFKNNSAIVSVIGSSDSYAYGGALYNAGTAILTNSSFMYNSAVNVSNGNSQGGAIYNEGTLSIIADGSDVEFTGNTSTLKSNAVHNAENAEMNLNAGSGDSIVFNDAITGDSGIININMEGSWDLAASPGVPDGNKIPDTAPTTGIIVFNNAVTGNGVNLYDGVLKLGIFDGIEDAENEGNYLAAASRGSIGTSSVRNNLTIYGGAELDTANGRADDTIYVSSFNVVNGTANVKMDVDLISRGSDRIDISVEALGGGKLSFYGMSILNDIEFGISENITIFTNPVTMTADYLDEVDFVTYGSSGVYRITQGSDNRSLNFLLTEYTDDPFQHAVSTQTGDRSYTLTTDYNVPANFNSLLSTGTLHIFGGEEIAIYGNKVSNVFNIADADTVLNLSELIITDAQAEEGGAVYNLGTANIFDVIFKENIAASTFTAAKGGAVYNENQLNIYDSSFIGNAAVGTDAAGGAIYSNGGVVNVIAQNSDVEFQNNSAENKSNAVHLSGGAKLNLNALSGKVIFLNDALTSDGNNNIININAAVSDDPSVIVSGPSLGILYLNGDMSEFGNINSASGNIVNLYNSAIKFGEQTAFFKDVTFNMHEGSRLDMTNLKIDNVSVSDFNLPDAGSAYVSIDVDLRKGEADNFVGSVMNNDNGELVIDKIILLNDLKKLETKVSIEISDDNKFMNALRLSNDCEEILGPVFAYYVSYGNGILNLEHTFDFNPSVFIAPITMQTGGYLGQLNSYDQAFSIIDKALSEESVKGLWIRPYAYNDNIELTKRLTITNTAYGAYAGYNSEPSDMGRSVSGVFSLYGAYNASDQSYDGATITQGGGLVGVTAVLFKERFYTAFTANLGVVSEHGEGRYGKDNFMMYTKGIAVKSGYNFYIDSEEKFTLQPSLNLSFSVIEVSAYRNTAGVKVDVERFSPFHVEPGVKLSTVFENDLISFVNLSGVWSLSNETKGIVDDIRLPVMSVDPYVQYGVGVEKAFSDKISAGAELYGRSLGRAGIGGQLSLRWNF